MRGRVCVSGQVGGTSSRFADIQREFANYLRDPDIQNAPAGMPADRVAIYRSLVRNNLRGLLGTCFPVLRAVLGASAWAALVDDFLRRHRARTPLFTRLPEEFLDFLMRERSAPYDPAYLRELAAYEWLELEVDQDPRELADVPVDVTADVCCDVPVVNPLARLAVYAHPVHRIVPNWQADGRPTEPTFLVVYRGRDARVHFAELTAATARLFEAVSDNPREHTGNALLDLLAVASGRSDRAQFLAYGRAALHDLRTREVLVGARRRPDRVSAGG
jgi:hypothetical protein